MKIWPRKSWTHSQARGDTHKPRGGTLFVHYTVSSSKDKTTLNKQTAHLRALRDGHLTQGYVDISYNFLVFQPAGKIEHARVFKGRGVNRVPAAQQGHNTGNLAVAVVMKPGDKLHPETEKALKKLYRELRRKGYVNKVRGHKDVNSTTCPGLPLYKFLPELRKA